MVQKNNKGIGEVTKMDQPFRNICKKAKWFGMQKELRSNHHEQSSIAGDCLVA